MPTVSVINTKPAPKLIFPPKIFEELRYIVDQQEEEVGWLFTVDVNDDGDYVIGEVFVPPQEVHSTEADIEAQAYLDWYNVLEEAGKNPAERLYGWGHSHVNMGVTPSAQDDQQFLEYGDTCPFFIRTIHNKKGEIRVDIAHFHENLLYSNCEWQVQYAQLSTSHMKMLDDRMKMNVKKAPPSYSPPHRYGGKGSGNVYDTYPYNRFNSKRLGNKSKGKSYADYSQKKLDELSNDEYYELFECGYLGGI